ncbi:MAG: hypothetical protein F4X17_01690 [Gemmatimonadetes bacterium]|nr:hypothetical protein [Gemmatimonadota bacterium]
MVHWSPVGIGWQLHRCRCRLNNPRSAWYGMLTVTVSAIDPNSRHCLRQSRSKVPPTGSIGRWG